MRPHDTCHRLRTLPAVLLAMLLSLQLAAATHAHAGEGPAQPETCEICVLGHGLATTSAAPDAPAQEGSSGLLPLAAAQIDAARPGVRAHASRAPPFAQT